MYIIVLFNYFPYYKIRNHPEVKVKWSIQKHNYSKSNSKSKKNFESTPKIIIIINIK